MSADRPTTPQPSGIYWPSAAGGSPLPGAIGSGGAGSSPRGEWGVDETNRAAASTRRSMTVLSRAEGSPAEPGGPTVVVDGRTLTPLSEEEAWQRLWRGEALEGVYVRSLHLGYEVDNWANPHDVGTERYIAEHLRLPGTITVREAETQAGQSLPRLKYEQPIRILGSVIESLSLVGVELAQPIELRDVRIHGDLRIAPPEPVEGRSESIVPTTRFQGSVEFDKVHVDGSILADRIDARDTLALHACEVEHDLQLRHATLAGHFSITRCEVRGDMGLSRTHAKKPAAIEHVSITGPINANGLRCDDGLSLDHFGSAGTLMLIGARLRGNLNTDRLRVGGGLILRDAILAGEIECTNMRVGDDFVLSDATIEGPFSAYRTKVGNHLRCHGTHFQQTASFQDVHVTDSADFRGAKFDKYTDFRRSTFSDWAIFFNTEFGPETDFFGARFSGECLFNRDAAARASWGNALKENVATIGGPMRFRGTYFYRQAVFDAVTFPEDVSFDHAYFGEKGSFADAVMLGDADYSEARAQEELDFSRVRCHGLLSFRKATLAGPVDLVDAQLDRFRITGAVVNTLLVGLDTIAPAIDRSVGTQPTASAPRPDPKAEPAPINYQDVAEAYNVLKTSFNRRGDLEAEDRAYARFKRAQRQHFECELAGNTPLAAPWTGNTWVRRWLRIRCGIEAFLFDRFSEYGTNPKRTLALAALMIFAFGLIYTIFDFAGEALVWDGAEVPAVADGAEGGSYISQLPFLDRLALNTYFSAMTFTTMGYGDVHPNFFGFVKIIVAIEAFLGVFVMTLFVGTYARKIIR